MSAIVWLLISGVHQSWVWKDPHMDLSLPSWAAAELSLLTFTLTRFPQWNQKSKSKPHHSGTMYRFVTVLGGLRILKSMAGLHWSLSVEVSSAIDKVLIGCFIYWSILDLHVGRHGGAVIAFSGVRNTSSGSQSQGIWWAVNCCCLLPHVWAYIWLRYCCATHFCNSSTALLIQALGCRHMHTYVRECVCVQTGRCLPHRCTFQVFGAAVSPPKSPGTHTQLILNIVMWKIPWIVRLVGLLRH